MKSESRRYGRLAGVLPVVLFAAIAAAPAAAEPAGDQPACVESSPEAAAAHAAAVECGQPVEVLGARTEYSRTFANPDGTATLEQSVVPQRVRRGDGWVPVDTSLRATPAGVAPVASVLPMTFSAGGSGQLARLTSGAHELALTWDGVLPAPKLSGSTALYRNVLPGVDLAITAEPTGFSEVLVVRSRAAAANPRLSDLYFGLTTKGVTVSADEGGGLVATDPEGRRVFTSPAPMMWDSGEEMVDPAPKGASRATASDGTPAATAKPVRRAAMPVRVEGDRLHLTPDRSILDDPATTFPVYIDPTWTGGISNNAWTMVWSKYPNSSFWRNSTALNNGSTKGAVGAGRTRDCGTCSHHIIRTMFQMDLSGVAGKHVVSADFRIEQRWAWTCSPASDAALWRAPAFSSGTTWNNQGTWTTTNRAQTPGNRKLGAVHGCQGPGVIQFNATSMVAGAVDAGATTLSMGLRALNEGTLYQWKRFFHNTATLVITYNTPPNAPTGRQSDGQACATGSNAPYVTTLTPTLSAQQSDPDQGPDQSSLTTWFHWWPAGGTRNDTDRVSQSGANPATVSAAIPAGRLVDGQTYAWQAYTNDGRENGAWSQPCEFVVDGSPPAPPAGVSSTDYPADGQRHGAIGTPGLFTIAPPALRPQEVVAYAYTLDASVTPAQAPTVAAGAGHGATVTVAPPQDGTNELRVWSKDRAGRFSDTPASYTFLVRSPLEKWVDITYGDGGVGGAAPGSLQSGGVDGAGRAIVLSRDASSSYLRRLTADGHPDPTYPQVTLPHSGIHVAVDAEGRASVVGTEFHDGDGDGNPDGSSVLVSRYTAAGTLDTTFGTGGTATIVPPGQGSAGVVWLADRAGDGLIVSWENFTVGERFVAALTDSGTLDTTWAPDATTPGILPLSSLGLGGSHWVRSLLVDAGSVLVVQQYAITRLTATGSLDQTFGDGGIVSAPANHWFRHVATVDDGLVVSASVLNVNGPGVVLKLTSNGDPDASFGIDGAVQIDACDPPTVHVAGGWIYLVGAGCGLDHAVITRLGLAGAVDPTYGDGGQLVIEEVEAGALRGTVEGLGIQPNGKPVVAIGNTTDEWSAVIRLHNEPYGGAP